MVFLTFKFFKHGLMYTVHSATSVICTASSHARTLLWKNIGTFLGSQEIFCEVCGPHFDISGDEDIVDMFQEIFDITPMHDIVHIEQDKMGVVHVSGEWHVTETNTKLTRFPTFWLGAN
jgi:hypothetical protein